MNKKSLCLICIENNEEEIGELQYCTENYRNGVFLETGIREEISHVPLRILQSKLKPSYYMPFVHMYFVLFSE